MKLWFRVDADASTDLKIEQLADALAVKPAHANGLMLGVWCGVARHAEHGDLTGVGDGTIEGWARWDGKRGRFAAEFRARFVDPDGVLHGWCERQGSLIERMAKDRKRQRDKYRQAKERIDALSVETSTEISTENRPILSVVSTPTLTPTIQDSTSVIGGGSATGFAVQLTTAANQGITARYTEQPSPLVWSSPSATEVAESIAQNEIPPDFAVRAVYSAAASCKADRPPKSLKYFLPQVLRAWEEERARAQIGSSPTPNVIPLTSNDRRKADTKARIDELLRGTQ